MPTVSATLRREKSLSELTGDIRIRLTNAALKIVIPAWRALAARSIGNPRQTEGAVT